MDTPFGREGSDGSKGSEGSKGGGIALSGDEFCMPLRGMENRTTAPNGQSIKRKALLCAGYGPTSTDLHILCRMCTARGNAPLLVLTHHLSPGGGDSSGSMLSAAYESKS